MWKNGTMGELWLISILEVSERKNNVVWLFNNEFIQWETTFNQSNNKLDYAPVL